MSFEDAQELLLDCFAEGYIDEDEFLALYKLNTSQNPRYPYKNYRRFQLQTKDEAECLSEFRFNKMIFLFSQRHSEYQKLLNVIKGRYVTELRGFAFY